MPLISSIPIPALKKWLKEYKEEKPKEPFESWVEDHAWMLVDTSYTKPKNYTVFLLDEKDRNSIFGSIEIIGEEVNSEFIQDYFRPLFDNLFLDEDGSYIEKNLEDWIKQYTTKSQRDVYKNLVDARENLDEPEFSQILLTLFISSLGVSVENYFDYVKFNPPTIEEAEFLIQDYLDCSDPGIELRDKWRYLEKNGRFLNSETIKRTLYQMLRSNIPGDQRRVIAQLSGMKGKKLKLSVIQDKLNTQNQHLFCSIWQKISGA